MHHLFDSHALVLLVTVDIMGKIICYIILKNNSAVNFKKNLNFPIRRGGKMLFISLQESE